MVTSAARRLAQNALRPISRELSAIREYAQARSLTTGLLNQLSSLGLIQMVSMQRADDPEATPTRVLSAMILEELAWGDANCAVAISAPLGFVRAIVVQGSDRQRDAMLPLFQGEDYRGAAIASSEPGLNPGGLSAMRTEIISRPKGAVLRGRKALVPMAARCGHFLVIAKAGGALNALLVPANATGVTIDPPRYTTGCTSAELSDVLFEDVAVSPDMVLGEEKGCDVQQLVSASWIASSAILSGIARAAYEDIKSYIKERKVGGDLLAGKQAVAMRVVDMFTASESMPWMGWRAAAQIDAGRDAVRLSRLAHGRAVDCAGWITDEALQLMGGHGFMAENMVESWYRNSKTVSGFDTALGI